MYDRKYIERVLTVNGLTVESSDEQIRSMLSSARYRDEEVEQALQVLRGNYVASGTTATDSVAQKILRTDSSLSPSEVSRLLGIDVSVQNLTQPQKQKDGQLTGTHIAMIVLLSLLVATIGLGIAMYAHGFGVFYYEAA